MIVDNVYLSVKELKFAEEIAKKRNRSQRNGNRLDGKVVKDSLGIDIQGAQAELAVSIALGLEWDGDFKELSKWHSWRIDGHDVSGLEVRSTHHKNGSLILHPKDKDNSKFILVIVESPKFKLVGWNFGREGKIKKYWRDVGYGRPCYMLPQCNLKSIKELNETKGKR
jgi:hypothetical protein